MDFRRYIIEWKVFDNGYNAYKFFYFLVKKGFSPIISNRINVENKSIDTIVRWKVSKSII